MWFLSFSNSNFKRLLFFKKVMKFIFFTNYSFTSNFNYIWFALYTINSLKHWRLYYQFVEINKTPEQTKNIQKMFTVQKSILKNLISKNLSKFNYFSTLNNEIKFCIVGGGAAGFYSSQYLLKHLPNTQIE